MKHEPPVISDPQLSNNYLIDSMKPAKEKQMKENIKEEIEKLDKRVSTLEE